MITAHSLSFVVLNYNSDDLTLELLTQLQDLFPTSEKVVVSNGLGTIAEDSVAWVSGLVQVASKNKGYAAGNNLGFAKTGPAADYVVFLNPDVRFPEDMTSERFLNALGKTFTDKKVHVAAIDVKGCHPFFTPPRSAFSLAFPYLRRIKDKRLDLSTVYRFHGAAFVIKKTDWPYPMIFEEKTFLYFEEDIFALTIVPNLKPIVLLADIEVLHNTSTTVNTHIRWSKYRHMYNSLKLALAAYRGRSVPVWDSLIAFLGICVLAVRSEIF